jgi:hypothetical protein
MKVICADLLYLQFGFEIFWQMNMGAKAVCKKLKKLTTGIIALDIRKVIKAQF